MHHRFSQAMRDQRGSVLILSGILFLVMVAVAGAGFDFGRRELVRLKLQQATDAAALAGAMLPNGTSVADRKNEVLRYYKLNFPDTYIDVKRPDSPVINITANVEVSANLTMPTSFIENVGVATLPVKARSLVTIGSNQIDYDLVMVIDESGSTQGSIMALEKAAILQMLDVVFPKGGNNRNVRFGLVGYSQWISNKWGLTSSKGDAASAVAHLNSRNSNYDHWGMEAGYNMITGNVDAGLSSGEVPPATTSHVWDCIDQWYTAVLPPLHACYYIDQKTKLGVCAIPTKNNQCMTFGPIYTAVLRNTNVPPPRTARVDGLPVSKVKNVIFLTDGYIMVEPDGCIGGHYYKDSYTPGAPCPNYPAFLAQCQKLKDAGATVFTISYVSQSAGDIAALQQCASFDAGTGKPRYFYAPDGTALTSILKNIGLTIRKVRIAE